MSKVMRLLALPILILVVALSLVGCGGGAPHGSINLKPPVRANLVTVCSGLTGKCVTGSPTSVKSSHTAASSGCKIPDVSSYQGHPDWARAKGSICGAIFKGGEYSQDPDASYNNSELARLHIWRAMYWFVRNTGCSHEAAQIIGLARAFGIRVVVNDLEASEASGYSACLVPAERGAGLVPVDYTSPGTWPGGGFGIAPLWQAEYGPVLHPFWQPVVAWQCTDGVYGCATYIPGIGRDDVSIDLGITNLGAPPPDPILIFPNIAIHSPFGTLHERELILSYLGARAHPVKYARYLKYVLEPRLGYTAHRIAWLAVHVWGHPGHANWTRFDAGSRFQYEIKASAGRLIHVG